MITLRQRASSATRGDKAVQMAVHGGWARCDPWSSRMLAGGMPPPPLSLPGVLACLLLEPAGNGTGWGGLLVEVGAGLGQGVLEWVGAGGSAVAVELLESNAKQLRWSRDLNGWSRDALVVTNAAAGPCPDAAYESRSGSGPGRVEEWGVVAYVVDASEANGFLLEDMTGGEASPEVFSRYLARTLPRLTWLGN